MSKFDLPITEKRNKATTNIDKMDSFSIAQIINSEDKKIAFAIEKELKKIGKAIELISDSFLSGGRMAYFGAGTSGRLGILDASEMLPTFNTKKDLIQAFIAGGDKALRHAVEGAEDKASLGLKDLKKFFPTTKDIIVCLSASGNPAYILAILEKAKKIGCKTISISSNPKAKAKDLSDIFINPVVGEEVIAGSSRMKSGTSQKMILNMLSTGAMIRIGKTYQNYMIDLRTTNKKLTNRAEHIISEICKIPLPKAKKYFRSSGQNLRIACIMANRNCNKSQAKQLLQNSRGILRKILQYK